MALLQGDPSFIIEPKYWDVDTLDYVHGQQPIISGDTINAVISGPLAVTGAFYQATQPVSLASLPLPSDAATGPKQDALLALLYQLSLNGDGNYLKVYQGVTVVLQADPGVNGPWIVDGSGVTQPVSIASAVPVTDNGGSLTVDGAFWQATQPVSGTFFQATQPVSLSSVPTHGVTGPLTDTELRAVAVPVSIASVPSHAVTNAGTFAVQATGTVTANAGTNLNTSALALEATVGSVKTAVEVIDNFISGSRGLVTEDSAAAIKTAVELIDNFISGARGLVTEDNSSAIAASLSVMDDWDETDRAKVNIIVGQAGIAAGTGVDGVTVPRVTLATNVALPAGTNAIGKLAANSGVDIGDVDVTSLPAITGSVTANAGTNLNTSALALEAGGNLAGAAASLSVLDDWDESDRAKTNPIVGQAGVAGGTGVDAANVQRVSLATNVALPAGANAIGKLAANSGVDIGDVDIASIAAGDNNIGNVDIVTMPAITGTVTANAGTNLNTSALALETTLAALNAKVTAVNTGAVVVSSAPTTAVTGPVTDAQLRASAVPMSLAALPVLVAGAAVIGQVGIDQTTPGTTNRVQASANVLAIDTDAAYTDGAIAQPLTQTLDGRLRTVTAALVSDVAESYITGTIRSLSLNTEGRLRVSAVPADTFLDHFVPFDFGAPTNLYDADLGSPY